MIKKSGFIVIPAVVALAGAGCASGRALTSDVDLVSAANATFRIPFVTAEKEGVRVSGWICRRNRQQLPVRRVQVELLSADGSVIDAFQTGVWWSRKSRCELYRAQTQWRPAAERLRVCAAARDRRSCASSAITR